MGSPKLSLTVQFAVSHRALPKVAQFRRWISAALVEAADVTLRVVDEEEGLALNSAYRQKNYATNVLTFVYSDSRPVCGDVVLCLPVIAREARAQGKTLNAHLAHLTVHGMLHVQGFDHESGRDAELMEGIETEILAGLGYADPYAELPR